jgi:hypothetical protein
MLEFHRVSYILAQFQGIRPFARLNGPSVICTAWIPYYARSEELPDCGFRRYAEANRKWWRPSAMDFMFRSGNPQPFNYGSRAELLVELQRNEFRGILALDDISALVTRDGEFMGAEFAYLGAAGYTPVRRKPGAARMICKGYSDGDYEIGVIPREYLTIDIWHSFKLGRAVDLAQYLLTWQRATSAMMRIRYTFTSSQDVEISLSGSAVPSQTHLVGWNDYQGSYDMMRAGEPEISGFFSAGRCVTAPISELHRVNRRGVYKSY